MWNPEIFVKSINFAGLAHKDQKVPGKEMSYMVHLVIVTNETLAACLTDSKLDINFAMQCALLHDTIEDTEVTYHDIVENFGKNVAEGVLALTKNTLLEKSLQMVDSLDRIKNQPSEIWIVKLADRISNLQKPPIFWDKGRAENYLKEANLIYQNLHGKNKFIDCRFENKMKWYKDFLIEIYN